MVLAGKKKKKKKPCILRWVLKRGPFTKVWAGCVCCAKSLQSYQALWDPMDYIAHQAPLSMGLSRQEYWSGLPWPPPGGFPNPGSNCISYFSALAGGFLTTSATWARCEESTKGQHLRANKGKTLLPPCRVKGWGWGRDCQSLERERAENDIRRGCDLCSRGLTSFRKLCCYFCC